MTSSSTSSTSSALKSFTPRAFSKPLAFSLALKKKLSHLWEKENSRRVADLVASLLVSTLSYCFVTAASHIGNCLSRWRHLQPVQSMDRLWFTAFGYIPKNGIYQSTVYSNLHKKNMQNLSETVVSVSISSPIPTRKLVSSWFPIVFPGNFEPWPWLPSGLPTHGLAGDFEVKPSDQWLPAWPRGSPDDPRPPKWPKSDWVDTKWPATGDHKHPKLELALKILKGQTSEFYRILICPHDDSSHFITCAKSQTPAQNTCWMCSSRILWSFASLGHSTVASKPSPLDLIPSYTLW